MAEFEVKVYPLKIEEHPNADALELGVVGEYRSCIRKGDFEDGQLVAYIPENSVLPDSLIEEMGLTGRLAGKDKNRVKAVKLRKVLSQGLVYAMDGVKEGDDVTEQLGVTKYEPPIPTSMRGQVKNVSGKTLKYDIENIKKFPNVITEGEWVSITEKLHGTWACFGFFENELIVTSKGLSAQGLSFDMEAESNRGNLYVKMFRENAMAILDIIEEVKDRYRVDTAYVLGEIYGKGVQDLDYGVEKPELRVFDIYAGRPNLGEFLGPDEIKDLCDNADPVGIDLIRVSMVPELYRGEFYPEVLEEHTKGQTTLRGNHTREGVVIRVVPETTDYELGRVILKSVSEKYLLRKGATEYN